MADYQPAYIRTTHTGKLREKIQEAYTILENCTLCPRQCRVNRMIGETGVCKTGEQALVSSFTPHFGEESPLVGNHGSGTIFFTYCNLLCNFCQNYEISHLGQGEMVRHDRIAAMMLALQEKGCHNINLVTPTHVVPQILKAVETAAENGLHVPIVYNTGGYDRIETLKLLNGVVDIYMPDFKFWSTEPAKMTCNAPDYPETACAAVVEMHRQVGDLMTDDAGIAVKGLLVRHLVMPGGLAETGHIMRYLAETVSKNTYVNIMPQYRPCGRASEHEALNIRVSQKEYESAVSAAKDAGMTRLDRPKRVFRII